MFDPKSEILLRGADAVVTICNGLKQDLVARGNAPERITIMPNGVDLALFGTPVSRDPALAEKLGLGDGPVIGCIGSFYDYEGIDDLIAAMPALVARHADARLLLVGGGPMAEALQAQAAASPVASAIHFVGRVPHDQVERYYSLCDIMAYPRKASRLTDLVTPLKPLEAMAQGQLFVASDVGGHKELVKHNQTGILFQAGNKSALADAIQNLLSNRQRWPELKANGRHFVEAVRNWRNSVAHYEAPYQARLAQQGNP